MLVWNRTLKPMLLIAALAALAPNLAAASPGDPPAAVSGASEAKPWYADRLQALGFEVVREPYALPDFAVAGLDGKLARLSSQKGKLVLLNFWATWCPPCRAEMPSIQKLWAATRAKGLSIMAISLGEKEPTVKAFIGGAKYSFPVFLDPQGGVGSQYGVSAIPTTYVVDKSGRAIARVVGSIEYDGPEALSLFAELAAR
jgi:peroxiredoxin